MGGGGGGDRSGVPQNMRESYGDECLNIAIKHYSLFYVT